MWSTIVLVVAGIIYYAIRSRSAAEAGARLEQRGGRPVKGGHAVVRRGVRVVVRPIDAGGEMLTEASARVLVPSGLRFLRRRNWEKRDPPGVLSSMTNAAILERGDEGLTRSDTLTALPPIDGLAAPWRVLMHTQSLLIGCDGRTAFARMTDEPQDEVLDALIDAVVAVARWDDGLASILAALPGARVLDDHELTPAVALPDGLVIGCRNQGMGARMDAARGAATAKVALAYVTVEGTLPDGCTTALARAGDGTLVATEKTAHFTWTEIQRDPDRILAAVEALRALA